MLCWEGHAYGWATYSVHLLCNNMKKSNINGFYMSYYIALLNFMLYQPGYLTLELKYKGKNINRTFVYLYLYYLLLYFCVLLYYALPKENHIQYFYCFGQHKSILASACTLLFHKQNKKYSYFMDHIFPYHLFSISWELMELPIIIIELNLFYLIKPSNLKYPE